MEDGFKSPTVVASAIKAPVSLLPTKMKLLPILGFPSGSLADALTALA